MLKSPTSPIALGFLCTVALSSPALSQSLSLVGSAFSEPTHRGLSETSGEPGVGLTVDWEANRRFFLGASGYVTSSGPTPDRTRGLATYAGLHWGNANELQFDLTLIHRLYDGNFRPDWDYSEVTLDVGFSPQLGATLAFTDDYYGTGANSYSAVIEYERDFTNDFYSRIELGHVDVDSPRIRSYSYGVVSAGVRIRRWGLELGYRFNNARPYRIFPNQLIDNQLVLSASWLIY